MIRHFSLDTNVRGFRWYVQMNNEIKCSTNDKFHIIMLVCRCWQNNKIKYPRIWKISVIHQKTWIHSIIYNLKLQCVKETKTQPKLGKPPLNWASTQPENPYSEAGFFWPLNKKNGQVHRLGCHSEVQNISIIQN